ncbi:hypothetical protein P280DRAFT_514266 [Massarina eburnea CBS 473.64]|uniref:Uncharacterized protein n=1 Tax=Massarina eburnea CBS 473.64 TaxID=1395130 RepID=A0A6A6SAJ5_9PLEO|nr:hypothetical protein P280DRAFT_514266 [Massarina eburnea CBS 473.64]
MKFAANTFGFVRPMYSPQCVFSEKHMDMYVHWLQDSAGMTVQSSDAPFPTSREFNGFIRAQGSKYAQAIHPCEHPRHPSDIFSNKYCPVCLYKMHENYIQFIGYAWERKGAPWAGNRADKEYSQIKHAHLIARMVLANDMDIVEDMAHQERKWNAEHPAHDTSNTNSFCKVLDLYQAWVMQDLEDLDTVSRHSIHDPLRKVSFTNDTPDCTAEKGRPGRLWNRRSAEYTAGRHACPSKDGWEDTSGASSYVGLLMQCKLYIVESPSDMDDTNNPPENATYAGLLGGYPHQIEVVSRIEKLQQETSNQREFMRYLKASDAIFLLKARVIVGDKSNKFKFIDVRPMCLEKDGTASSKPSQWDVNSDPSVLGGDEMDWE